MDEDQKLKTMIREQIERLPKIVKDAIAAASVEKSLQALAAKYKLHLDQGTELENEVMLTLLGVHSSEDIVANIRKSTEIPDDIVPALSQDVVDTVFEPIREELERQLEHPDAKAVEVSTIEKARTSIISGGEGKAPESPTAPPAAPVAEPSEPASASSSSSPVVPPKVEPAKPSVMRAPISESYKPQTLSAERKDVEGDPYREPLA